MTMQIHLEPDIYDCVAKGTKNVEARVNDEKRQKLQIGDEIEILRRPDDDEKVVAIVTGLKRFKTFAELADAYPIERLYSSTTSKEEYVKLFSKFYSNEEIEKYGTVAIEFELSAATSVFERQQQPPTEIINKITKYCSISIGLTVLEFVGLLAAISIAILDGSSSSLLPLVIAVIAFWIIIIALTITKQIQTRALANGSNGNMRQLRIVAGKLKANQSIIIVVTSILILLPWLIPVKVTETITAPLIGLPILFAFAAPFVALPILAVIITAHYIMPAKIISFVSKQIAAQSSAGPVEQPVIDKL